MALLYEPIKKIASIQYVYYRSIERKASGFKDKAFYQVTGNLEGFLSKYYTNLFRDNF